MKLRILGVVALLIATFAAVRTAPASAAPGSLECTRFCMVALCPDQCGLHNTPTGVQCGCFSSGGPVG